MHLVRLVLARRVALGRILLLTLVAAAAYTVFSKPVAARQGFTGGILELATSTTTRVLPTAAQVGMPAGRGCITLPAPYNTTICKLTDNAADCNGQDCVQQEGYSNVSNCNYNTGEPVIKCFVGLQNTTYVTIFSIDKATRTVQKLGSVATSGSLSSRRGTLWFFSPNNKDLLYAFDGTSRMFECNIASLPAACTAILDVQSPAAAAVHGLGTTNLRVGEAHPSHDGDKFGLSLTNYSDQRDRGCLYFQKSTQIWKWLPHPAGTGNGGTINCHFSLDGNNVGAMMENPTGPLNTFAYDWATMTQRWVLSDPGGSPGHQSAWWNGNCGADNWSQFPAAFRCWYYDRGGISTTAPYAHVAPQGTTVNYTTTWSPAVSFNQISCLHQDGSAAKNWCSITASEDPTTRNPSQPRDGEVWLTTTDGSLRLITLAPTFRDIDSGGGADNYNRAPKPNTSGGGESIFWISNAGGSPRLEAFVLLDVDLAGQRLINWSGGGGPADTTPPTASMTAPANGSTVGGTVTVSASASDNVGVIGVQFLLDGGLVGSEDTTSPYSISWNSVGTANGNHTLAARARDAAGNTTTSTTVTVNVQNVVDTTPPAVNLTAPVNGSTVSGTISVDATASDNIGVVGVQFLLDGINLGAEDMASPYSVSWNTALFLNGSHTLTARARDGAGNTTTSAARTVTVSNSAQLPAGLVAAFGYDENVGTVAADASPTGNNASLSSASWAPGRYGSALFPNGAVYAESNDHPALTPGVTFTLEAWVYLTSAPTELASILNKWNQSAEDEFIFGLNTNRQAYVAWQTTGGAVWGTPSFNEQADQNNQVPLNTWTHLAVIRNGPILNFYFNGILSASYGVMDANPLRNGTNSLRVGSQNRGGATRAFPGRIDELRIYTSVLTDPQLQLDLNSPIGSAGDTAPPAVSVSAPANGATVSGTTSVTATASDNVGVVGVQFLLDGADLGAEDTSSPYSVSWNTTTATNGSHTLTARARDAAGNTTTSTSVTVTVSNTPQDTTPPTVSMTAPANGATVTGTITVSANASDNVGVVGVQFRLDGANLGAEDTSSPFSVSWNTATASIGAHTLTAVARDAAGNTTTSAAVTVTVLDTVAPTASVSAPANGATVSGTITVSAIASDNVGVVGVQFLLDGANLGSEDTTNPYSVSWNTTTVSNGNHTLTARARDAAGNTTTATTITVNVQNADTTAPTVSMTAPANGATVTGTISVTATAADNIGVVGVQFLLDGANLGAEDTNNPYSVSWNTTTASAGSHSLTARARDAAGNTTTSAAVTVTVPDTSAPAVSISAPANGATVTGTISVTATASDNVGVVGVQFLLDGANLGAEDTSNPFSTSWNTATASIGSHTLTARARDAAGNTTTSASVTVTVPDTTAPAVSISAPANGATVSGSVTVSATASDNVAVAGVQFLLDGANLGAEDTASPYAVSWNTASAAAGSHALTAVARDAAGNTTTSSTVTVTVLDTTSPTVSISAPANGATVNGGITVSATAADNVGVAGVQFKLDGANLGAEDTSSPFSVSWATTSVANGNHTLSAVARDAAGNTTTATTITVNVQNTDTTAPTVSLTAPANGAIVSGTISVSATASDNVGVAGVQFLLDGANLGAEDTSNPYSVSWNTTTVGNGSHTLTAVARDAAGNTTTSTAVIVDVQNADTTAPAVSMTAPANGATVTGTITVSASATDNVGVVGVQFLLDGGNLGAEDTTNPYSVSWNASLAAPGSHTLTARARDAAGNTTTSAAVTVTVPDTSNPAVSITAPANGATVNGAISVTASASDNVGVAGVQFLVDGVNLGAEDTSSPYAASWNTTTVANGSHTLTAVARDAAGNTTTSAGVTVTVQNADTTAPTVSVTAPANGATVASSVTIAATAADNVGVSGVQFKVNGVDLGAEDTSSPYSVSWDTTTFANGTHVVTAVARDAAGNTTTSVAVTVTVQNTGLDTTPPTVSIDAPTNGSTVSAAVPVTATAADNIGVTGVQFKLDGANLGAEVTASPFTMSWNSGMVANGSHTLTAIARDAAGNTTTSAAVTVTVSNTTTPPAGLVAAYGYNEGGGTAALDSSPTGGTATLVGASWAAGQFGSTLSVNGSGFAETADTDPVTPGTSATFSAWVYLSSAPTEVASIVNKWSQTSEDEYLFGLTMNRNLYFSWHTTGSSTWGTTGFNEIVSSGQVPLNVWTHVAVVRNSAGLSFYVNGMLASTSSPMDANPFRNGVNSLRVGAQSRGGVNREFPGRIDELRIYSRNLTATEVQNDMNAPVGGSDTTPPTVNITAPPNGATVSGTFMIGAEATDNIGVFGVQFKIDGVNMGAEDRTVPFQTTFVTLGVPNGLHTLTAIARDAAGNTVTSAPVVVTVQNIAPDTVPPAVSLTAPIDGATVSGTVTVSAAASDNVGVVGVQFKLDGVNLGAEDTASPFSLPWITATVGDGVHMLTAVARDAAGNVTTSTARTVTVTNGSIIAGLIAAYAFDEGTGRTPADSSPLTNRGTLMGGASWTPGRYGYALATNGTGFAEATDLSALTPGTAATFEAWVYLNNPPGGLVSIVNKWSQSVDDEYLFGIAPNRRPYFAWKTVGATTWGNTSFNEVTASGGQLEVGTWTHVAVVRNGATLTFYVDGEAVYAAPVMDNNPFRDGRNTLRIGGQGRGATSRYFPGFIDDVRIYNRALTQAEIQHDMTTPIGGGGLQ